MAIPDTRAEVHRHLEAAPERVFAAFASSAMVARWLSPSPEIPVEVLAYDFRVDGRYRFGYRVPGAPVMHVNGIFRTISPPGQLTFSWIIEPPDEHAGIESEVRVTIEAAPGGAVLNILHERLDRPGATERHAAGWAGALDRLVVLVRSGVLS